MEYVMSRYSGPEILKDAMLLNLDKKRLTPRGYTKLVRENLVEEEKLRKFDVDESHEYNQRVHVFSIILPNMFVVHFEPPDYDCVIDLMYNLGEVWNGTNGFDLAFDVPGEGVHVLVAVEASRYPEDTLLLAKMMQKRLMHGGARPQQEQCENNQESQLQDEARCLDSTAPVPGPSTANPSPVDSVTKRLDGVSLDDPCLSLDYLRKNIQVLYYRGIIHDVRPGSDKYSATYEVFLYDKGDFRLSPLGRIVKLSQDFRDIFPPYYRVLQVPGIRPLQIRVLITELHSRTTAEVECYPKTWPRSTLELARDMLINKSPALHLDVLADKGVYIYGDLKIEEKQELQDVAGYVSKPSGVRTSYASYLMNKRIAYVNPQRYADDLLTDAVDEENLKWKKEARIVEYYMMAGGEEEENTK